MFSSLSPLPSREAQASKKHQRLENAFSGHVICYFSCCERLLRPIVNRHHPVKLFSVFPVVAVIDSVFFSIVVVSLLSIVVVVIGASPLIFILDLDDFDV